MQAVILAAGRGSRLAPLTDDKPKALVEVGGRTIFWQVVDSLVQGGVNKVVAVTSGYHLATVDEAPSGLKFRTVTQETPLGTSHALQQAGWMEKPFLLLGCDTIFQPEHIKAVFEADAEIALSVRADQAQVWHCTIIYYQGGKIAGIAEKPQFPTSTTQSLMLYKLPPTVFDYLPAVKKSRRKEYEIQDAINMMIADGFSVATVECSEYFHLSQASDIEKFANYRDKVME